MSDQNTRWVFSMPKDQFERFRDNPEFATLLTLARVVNALMFCFHALLESKDGDKPVHTRQRMNALLFSAAILYEGFAVAQTLGKHFRERDSYQNGYRKLLADPVTVRLRSTVLRSMRNDVAFHFSPDVAPSVLKNLNLDRYDFIVGYGAQEGQSYYQLADEVAFNHLIDEQDSPEVELEVFKEVLRDFTYVITEFVNAANLLIPDVLVGMGWTGRFEAEQENR